MPTKMHFAISALLLTLIWLLLSSSLAQEPVEIGLVRGHFSLGDGVWRAEDFGWFYYDLDEASGGEELSIDLENKTAEKGHIVYNSTVWSDHFAYKPWGSYYDFSYKEEKQYFSGYALGSIITPNINTFEKGQVFEILINNNKTITIKNILSLDEKYSLKIKNINKNTAQLSLLLSNKEVDNNVAIKGDTYIYHKKIGQIDNLPIIAVHIKDISSTYNTVTIDGVFQISTNYIKVNPTTINQCGRHRNNPIWYYPLTLFSDENITNN